MVIAAIAVLTATLAASPALQPADAPAGGNCDYRVYYLPFPPAENGQAARPPIINGEREKDDSFVVTVRRKVCSGRMMPGAGVPARWLDDPSQHTVTWSATVTPANPDRMTPPSSYLKGPTFRIGPDGETVLEQRK